MVRSYYMGNCPEGTTSRVTVLLDRLRKGEHAALDELMPLVYGELRRIAQSFFRGQRPGHTLQPTALVNEAYIRLFDDVPPQLADLRVRVRAFVDDHVRADEPRA